MYSASYGPKEFGRFPSVARSGQESVAQGLPWVIPFLPLLGRLVRPFDWR